MNGPPLDCRVRIEYPSAVNTSGRNVVTWTLLAVVWASVRDAIPSRSEAFRNGLAVGYGQTVVEFNFRRDVDLTMRILDGSRTLQIVGGPAELGHHWRTQVVTESVDL